MKLVLKITAGIILAVVVLLVGCTALLAKGVEDSSLSDKPGTFIVKAPAGKCWSGAIGNATRDGCGSARFKVAETIIVGNAQKQDDGGWPLTLRLVVDGETIDTETTTAQYGVVSVSE